MKMGGLCGVASHSATIRLMLIDKRHGPLVPTHGAGTNQIATISAPATAAASTAARSEAVFPHTYRHDRSSP